MKVYIDGDELSSVALRRKLNEYPSYQQTLTADYKENILAGLHNWKHGLGYGYGEEGPGFVNVTTSGTTGYPQRISHSRETIEQVVEANIKLLNLNQNSIIYSLYSPRGIAWTVLSLYLAAKLDCVLHIESFKGISYVDRIHKTRPTHTLLLPNAWKALHGHSKWQDLDYSSVDRLIIGSDFTPEGCMDELRTHNPNIVYNVYGSTEVPPIVLYSEEENVYTKDSVPDGCSVKLHNTQICAKWSTQKEYWISGDCVEGDMNKFTLNGRVPNMFKQDVYRVYPEQLEKTAVALGADLALCQQVRNRCVLHYTGSMDERAVEERYMDIPRFRVKKVDEIKVDDNLRKIIRTQKFED